MTSATRLGRLTYRINVPMSVALVLWCWLGRVPFGLAGWWVVVFPLIFGPILAVALSITIRLARAETHPPWFTRDETKAHWVMWVALAATEFFRVDQVDGSDRSIFTTLAGEQWASESWVLVGAALVVAVLGWLLVLLAINSAEHAA